MSITVPMTVRVMWRVMYEGVVVHDGHVDGDRDLVHDRDMFHDWHDGMISSVLVMVRGGNWDLKISFKINERTFFA